MEAFKLILGEAHKQLNIEVVNFHALIEDTGVLFNKESSLFIEPDSKTINIARIKLLKNLNNHSIHEIELHQQIINLIDLTFFDNINEETGLTDNSFYFFCYLIKLFFVSDGKNSSLENFKEIEKKEFILNIYEYILDKIEILSVVENKNYTYKKRIVEILYEINNYILKFRVLDVITVNKHRDEILNNLGNINTFKKVYFDFSSYQFMHQEDSNKLGVL